MHIYIGSEDFFLLFLMRALQQDRGWFCGQFSYKGITNYLLWVRSPNSI